MVWSRNPTLGVFFICRYRNISVTAIKMSIITKQMAPNTSVATNSNTRNRDLRHLTDIAAGARLVNDKQQ